MKRPKATAHKPPASLIEQGMFPRYGAVTGEIQHNAVLLFDATTARWAAEKQSNLQQLIPIIASPGAAFRTVSEGFRGRPTHRLSACFKALPFRGRPERTKPVFRYRVPRLVPTLEIRQSVRISARPGTSSEDAIAQGKLTALALSWAHKAGKDAMLSDGGNLHFRTRRDGSSPRRAWRHARPA
jgi:hypothetical protein